MTETKNQQIVQALTAEMNEAAVKAWAALARYKFTMFGYWAGLWVHLNRITGAKDPNPFRILVKEARNFERVAGSLDKLDGDEELTDEEVAGLRRLVKAMEEVRPDEAWKATSDRLLGLPPLGSVADIAHDHRRNLGQDVIQLRHRIALINDYLQDMDALNLASSAVIWDRLQADIRQALDKASQATGQLTTPNSLN